STSTTISTGPMSRIQTGATTPSTARASSTATRQANNATARGNARASRAANNFAGVPSRDGRPSRAVAPTSSKVPIGGTAATGPVTVGPANAARAGAAVRRATEAGAAVRRVI